jgi:glycosyltransferase involved in cell wall biosynthesis
MTKITLNSASDTSHRVVMFSAEFEPVVGGLGRVVVALSRELAHEGHDVHVITPAHPEAPAYEVSHGVHVHRVQAHEWGTVFEVDAAIEPVHQEQLRLLRDYEVYNGTSEFFRDIHNKNMAMFQHAMRLHQEKPFDIIHAHDWLVEASAWMLKAGSELPLVSTIHATEQGRNNGIHNDLQRYISHKEWRLVFESKDVIVNSRHMLNELVWTMSVPDSKIHIIPNGIDPSKFACSLTREELRVKHNLPVEGNVVLLVGRMVREKGVHVLLEAAPGILQQHPNTTFLIAGVGYYLPELKNLATSLNLNDHVRFFGQANDGDLKELLALSTVATAPSTYEPFGIVALEAMAAGVPLVSSDRGGLIDIVDHEQTGLTSYGENPNSLKDMVNWLLSSPELAEKLVTSAKRKIQEQYTWPAIALKTRGVYADVLAKH